MNELKKWQNMIECEIARDEICRSRVFTVMRNKTNELQERVDFLENLNMKFADYLTPDELIALGEKK